MFYKPGHFVFIHLPRTAGSSIERSLHDASGDDLIYSTCSPQADLHRHATAAVVRSICWDWESIYRWCVVRNVWGVIDNVIRGVSYGANQIVGALKSGDEIDPGAVVNHVEVFMVPPPKTEFLVLTIDLEAFGKEGLVKYTIPAGAIRGFPGG